MVIKQLSPDGNGALLGEPEEVVSVALSDLSVLVWAVEDCEDAIEKKRNRFKLRLGLRARRDASNKKKTVPIEKQENKSVTKQATRQVTRQVTRKVAG